MKNMNKAEIPFLPNCLYTGKKDTEETTSEKSYPNIHHGLVNKTLIFNSLN